METILEDNEENRRLRKILNKKEGTVGNPNCDICLGKGFFQNSTLVFIKCTNCNVLEDLWKI